MRFILILLALLTASAPALAQVDLPLSADEEDGSSEPAGSIATVDAPDDGQIARRLRAIFGNVDGLKSIQVDVRSGVVALSGEVTDPADIDRAEEIAARVDGVVTVENSLARSAEVRGNVAPVMARLGDYWTEFVRSLPLAAIALAVFVLFWFLGSILARWDGLWRRLAPNGFLADALATMARLVLTLVGIVIALDIIGATALLGAILGGAGVIGIALGFAMKDTVENYVSSIMLSLRHPFRANDHVVIGEHEGRVIRLTSRATILMTLDGNHLRLPNSEVFKATILNYTTNPERRFFFELGIDADDDPREAMRVGLAQLKALPFILDEPDPSARVDAVGDSNIIITFLGWVDQGETDWYKARSAAIRAVKLVLEAEGFGLPEPIYRLRFDGRSSPLEIARHARETSTSPAPAPKASASLTEVDDVRPDTDIDRKVEEERAETAAQDMLADDKPLE